MDVAAAMRDNNASKMPMISVVVFLLSIIGYLSEGFFLYGEQFLYLQT
jgi:hypothetical protein